MTRDEYQRPEGKLIESAMKAAQVSTRKLGRKVGLSDTRLRHVINGYQPVGLGQVIEIVGPASTLARMAEELNIHPDAMRAAGRGDAADAMKDLSTARANEAPPQVDEGDRIGRLEERLSVLERAVQDLQEREGDDHVRTAPTSQAEVSSADVHHLPVRNPMSDDEAMVAHETEGGLDDIEREKEETEEYP